jgi:hypothetical protein
MSTSEVQATAPVESVTRKPVAYETIGVRKCHSLIHWNLYVGSVVRMAMAR